MPIQKLLSGGIISNYRCPASCEHCLYGCSPTAEPGYMTEETTGMLCNTLRNFDCRSVHIGGGEPFLNIEGLERLIRIIWKSGLELEYIETNAAWITEDMERNRAILSRIVKAGGDCIMVSADPFHIEWIPFWKPLALINLLREMGISHFIWQQRYVAALASLDLYRTYNAEELCRALGYDLVAECTQTYGMSFNGRALNLRRQSEERKQAEALLCQTPCGELYNTSHFHVDYLGNYIPPGCTGIGIPVDALGKDIDDSRYPVLGKLLTEGLDGLWQYALDRGFSLDTAGYVSKCELCYELRKFLAQKFPGAYVELSPTRFYSQNY